MSRTRKPTAEDHALWALVGRNVKRLREAKGVTMEALAWSAGASKSYLSRVESGQNAPSLNMLRALAMELGTQPWQLLHPPEGPEDEDVRGPLTDGVSDRSIGQ